MPGSAGFYVNGESACQRSNYVIMLIATSRQPLGNYPSGLG